MFSMRRGIAFLAVVALVGCADREMGTEPRLASDAPTLSASQTGGSEGRAVRFVHRAPHAPAFKNATASVTARAGERSQVLLTFEDGTPFALLEIFEGSLRNANISGTPIPEGQAVTITLSRPDASRFLVDMQPSGLEFNPEIPAQLTFFYDYAAVKQGETVEVLKQHNDGETWLKTQHRDDRRGRRMKAVIDDFTRFAMSYPH